VRGLGKPQLEAQKRTDSIVFSCIRKNPGIHVTGLISKTGINPNSIVFSTKRLYKNKIILKLKQSGIFYKIKIPKNNVGYVCHYPELEKKHCEKLDRAEKQMNYCVKQLQKIHDEQFKQNKPLVKRLAEFYKLLIKGKDEHILFKFRNRLNIIKINESMIGFFIYKEMEKRHLKQNIDPFTPEFYFKILPKKLCSIEFESSEDFKEFYSRYNKERPWEFINPESKKKFPDAMNFILTHYYRRVN